MLKIGDKVKDDLTNSVAIIVKVDIDANGNIGYFVDNDYLGGGRHPWEITEFGEYYVN
jgi:hypothetical protein